MSVDEKELERRARAFHDAAQHLRCAAENVREARAALQYALEEERVANDRYGVTKKDLLDFVEQGGES